MKQIWGKEQVTIYAGVADVTGDKDGSLESALFERPKNIAVDDKGNVYITSNKRIRKIAKNQVTTLAGPATNLDSRGFRDGQGETARFDEPTGIVVDKHGTLFVCDRKNERIRKITSDGTVTTFAGNGKPGKKDGQGVKASFNKPHGLDIDDFGNLYVADMSNSCIRKITRDGLVSTIAGGNDGFKNGNRDQAQFLFPADVAICPVTKDLIVADQYNHQIRRISNLDGDIQVTTVAGMTECGYLDGIGPEAQFNTPTNVTVNPKGEIFVSDTGNNAIRKIFLDGTVETVAHKTRYIINVNVFDCPMGLCFVGDSLIVADSAANVLRKIQL